MPTNNVKIDTENKEILNQEEEQNKVDDVIKTRRRNLTENFKDIIASEMERKKGVTANGKTTKLKTSPSKPPSCWVAFDLRIIPTIATTASIYSKYGENDIGNFGSIVRMQNLGEGQTKKHIMDVPEFIRLVVSSGEVEKAFTEDYPEINPDYFKILGVEYIPEINTINFVTAITTYFRKGTLTKEKFIRYDLYEQMMREQYLSFVKGYFTQKRSFKPKGTPMGKGSLSQTERNYSVLGFVPVVLIPSCFVGKPWEIWIDTLLDSLVKTFKQNGVRFENSIYDVRGYKFKHRYTDGLSQERYGTYYVSKKYILQLMRELGYDWKLLSDISSLDVNEVLLRNRGLYGGSDTPHVPITEGMLDNIFIAYLDKTTGLKKNILKEKGIDLEKFLDSTNVEQLGDIDPNALLEGIESIDDFELDMGLEV